MHDRATEFLTAVRVLHKHAQASAATAAEAAKAALGSDALFLGVSASAAGPALVKLPPRPMVHSASREFARHIKHSARNVGRLSRLCHRRGLYNDPAAEINALTAETKGDLQQADVAMRNFVAMASTHRPATGGAPLPPPSPAAHELVQSLARRWGISEEGDGAFAATPSPLAAVAHATAAGSAGFGAAAPLPSGLARTHAFGTGSSSSSGSPYGTGASSPFGYGSGLAAGGSAVVAAVASDAATAFPLQRLLALATTAGGGGAAGGGPVVLLASAVRDATARAGTGEWGAAVPPVPPARPPLASGGAAGVGAPPVITLEPADALLYRAVQLTLAERHRLLQGVHAPPAAAAVGGGGGGMPMLATPPPPTGVVGAAPPASSVASAAASGRGRSFNPYAALGAHLADLPMPALLPAAVLRASAAASSGASAGGGDSWDAFGGRHHYHRDISGGGGGVRIVPIGGPAAHWGAVADTLRRYMLTLTTAFQDALRARSENLREQSDKRRLLVRSTWAPTGALAAGLGASSGPLAPGAAAGGGASDGDHDTSGAADAAPPAEPAPSAGPAASGGFNYGAGLINRRRIGGPGGAGSGAAAGSGTGGLRSPFRQHATGITAPFGSSSSSAAASTTTTTTTSHYDPAISGSGGSGGPARLPGPSSYSYTADQMHRYHDATSRAAEMRQVETTIVELGHMFNRMATLVADQGEVNNCDRSQLWLRFVM